MYFFHTHSRRLVCFSEVLRANLLAMNAALSFAGRSTTKYNAVRGVYCLTRRLKSSGGGGKDGDDDVDRGGGSDSGRSRQEAVDKLNELLKSMAKGNDQSAGLVKSPVELARPRQLARKTKQQNDVDDDPTKNRRPLGEKLASAAVSVAQSMGGDVKKTESELLNLLRIYNGEAGDASEKTSKPSARLGDLLSGMKIDRSQPPTQIASNFKHADRAERVRDSLNRRSGLDGHQRTKRKSNKATDNYVPINLFGSEPLDVFKNPEANVDSVVLPTWDGLYEKSLKTAVTHPPKDIYEQMVLWTEQGKMWTFPIDNEQGLDKEHSTFFAEHVFLEPLIDEWCPTKGPIRHFMELVCVGLSKNPFLSVEEKKDHINWFRQYFYEKNQLLRDIETFEIKSLPENPKEYYKPTIPNE